MQFKLPQYDPFKPITRRFEVKPGDTEEWNKQREVDLKKVQEREERLKKQV